MIGSDPARVLIAGDWHGNTPWATGVIGLLDQLLPDEPHRIVLHLGDFGLWPGGESYLRAVTEALGDAHAQLWFVEGNHEWYDRLHDLAVPHGGGLVHRHRIELNPQISWLPRGCRWTWHDRVWLALGGAVSVDRSQRQAGRDWWSDEMINAAQAHAVVRDGPADVMLCHDAPASVPLKLGRPSRLWATEDLVRSDHHRALLQTIVDVLGPSHLLHGHYHLSHDTTVHMGHGAVRVHGLAHDGSWHGNYGVLDTRSMAFRPWGVRELPALRG